MFHYLKIPLIEHVCLPVNLDTGGFTVIIKINYKLYLWDIKAPLITVFSDCFFYNKTFEEWKRNWQNNRSSAKNCSTSFFSLHSYCAESKYRNGLSLRIINAEWLGILSIPEEWLILWKPKNNWYEKLIQE